MMKSIKTWILVGLASGLLVACGQSGGGSGSKKSTQLIPLGADGSAKQITAKRKKVFT